jgi:hypothetical protein
VVLDAVAVTIRVCVLIEPLVSHPSLRSLAHKQVTIITSQPEAYRSLRTEFLRDRYSPDLKAGGSEAVPDIQTVVADMVRLSEQSLILGRVGLRIFERSITAERHLNERQATWGQAVP